MIRSLKLFLPLVLVMLHLGLGNVRATTFLQLQSTALGDGWFQYQLQVMNDPFFTEADITWLGIGFTNQIDQSSGSTNWSQVGKDDFYSQWAFTNGIPARPYAQTFLIRSSETAYKLGPMTNFGGAMVLLSLVLSECYPGQVGGGVYSQNIVGYAKMPCLVPCAPEEADGSPSNFVYTLKLVPDVQINHLVQDGSGVHGVDFLYDYESTFLLQGSADLNAWTNIDYIWSYPPETKWTTDKALGNYGHFFRVAIVAGTHTTALPPLNKALQPKIVKQTSLSATLPHVSGCQFINGKMAVTVAGQPGQVLQVQAINSHQTVLQSQPVMVQGASATVSFDPASLPNPVFFQATLIP